jgi:Flp pilus assembly pilin Flp
MKTLFERKLETLRRLHCNENGAEAGLERILLVAFIALPLLGLLMYYRGEVVKFIKSAWGTNTGNGPGDLTNGG